MTAKYEVCHYADFFNLFSNFLVPDNEKVPVTEKFWNVIAISQRVWKYEKTFRKKPVTFESLSETTR
jgi:hypothetical protein